jgi:hypothetical protein
LTDEKEVPNSFDDRAPKVDNQSPDLKDLVEYGYGFWARFLTAYPDRLLSGKNAAWYFIARLTVNKNFDNVRMGDRTLAMWQG